MIRYSLHGFYDFQRKKSRPRNGFAFIGSKSIHAFFANDTAANIPYKPFKGCLYEFAQARRLQHQQIV